MMRSKRCNGDLISMLRKRAGWTQSELACRTGFTERLIVKAEASQNVAAATLLIIVQTLNEAGIDVASQDLSADPTVLARAFLHSNCQFWQHSLDLNSHLMSDDLVVPFSGAPKAFSFAGADDSRPLKFAIRMNFKVARLTASDYQFDTLEFAKRIAELKV